MRGNKLSNKMAINGRNLVIKAHSSPLFNIKNMFERVNTIYNSDNKSITLTNNRIKQILHLIT